MPIIEIIEAGQVENTIVADESFAEEHYPGAWRLAAVQDMPPPEVRRITPLAFRRRYTSAERAAIEWAAVDRADDSPAQRQAAAALRSRLKDLEMAAFIDLDDADVIDGTQEQEAAGLIAAGRAVQILTAFVEPKEIP